MRTDLFLTQTSLRHLAEQLSLEYAGAVPASHIQRVVLTTGRRLHRRGYAGADLLRLAKLSVRAHLSTHIGATLAARALTPA
ncbi:hypothetical protein [Kribbella sp. CA-247076]|uniref:hypothetical protein n=1 Tax=Kribbella sp. CA-247076 TaxID=3239941 RepID=UPI003D925005